MLSFQDFQKLDIRIAKILEVNDHPRADKLWLLKIDTGDKKKQIVAGIRNFYKKEDLIGRQIVVIDNLEPVIIRGEASEGMLLAAQGAQSISILVPDRAVKEGSKVR